MIDINDHQQIVNGYVVQIKVLNQELTRIRELLANTLQLLDLERAKNGPQRVTDIAVLGSSTKARVIRSIPRRKKKK